jgi:hypothetical protein
MYKVDQALQIESTNLRFSTLKYENDTTFVDLVV